MGIFQTDSDIHLQRCPNLIIKLDTPKGRGVFATRDIPARTIIDVCPVLLLGMGENKEHIEHTTLYHYTYINGVDTNTKRGIHVLFPGPITMFQFILACVLDSKGKSQIAQAVIFGLGSMFNHSTQEQNVGWVRDANRLCITYRALRDIPAGEELCISYGSRLTFKDADSPLAIPPEEEIEQLRMIEPY